MENYDDIRRKQLGDFLKIRRSKISPEYVGFNKKKRRRTIGLRRSEVAELIEISVEWYTWLEQGRDIHVSSKVLEKLAIAFNLNPSERKHLFLLAQQQIPLDIPKKQIFISPTLQQFLDLQGYCPAYITNLRWDIIAWNQAACVIFGNYETMSIRERNTVWRAFTSPYLRQLLDDWEGHAQKRIAQFRASYSHLYDDPWWTTMVDELTQVSEEFRNWWSRYDILDSPEGTKIIHHPTIGKLQFQHLSFRLCDAPNLMATVNIPLEETTANKIKRYCQ
ncbi:MAG: transcriptional regulator [Firmicutes bacterium]|nr:transcriptional regulator [Bacillota bacterium]